MSQAVIAGTTASFTVAATGTQPFTTSGFNGTNLLGATNSVLNLVNAQMPNAGFYSVRVENAAGWVVSSNALLTVDPASDCLPPPSGLVSWWQGRGNTLDAKAPTMELWRATLTLARRGRQAISI